PLARRTAWPVVTLLVGLDPLLLNYAGRAYLEPMVILALALVVASIDRLRRQPNWTSMTVLGVVWGFSLLVKPVLLYLAIPLVPTIFAIRKKSGLLALG